MDPFLKKNSKLIGINSELENNVANMNAKFEEQKAELAELRALIMRQGREPTSCTPSPHRDISGENHAVIVYYVKVSSLSTNGIFL